MMVTTASSNRKELPKGLWNKCKKCEQIIFQKDFEENFMVCPKCGYYVRLSAKDRIKLLVDEKSFKETNAKLKPVDIIGFPGYKEKKESYTTNDAILTGEAKINSIKVMIAAMDFGFMGGSMGAVVGEKVVRLIEDAIAKKLPVIIVSASGGARMQEGILSLMQMAKTSAALSKLSEEGLPYISVLTDPTTGGVAASFAMLGDIIIAEPNTLIGFAGPRVIEQTIRQQLPKGFQLSEFLLKHGMVDIVVERKNLKDTLTKILKFFVKK